MPPHTSELIVAHIFVARHPQCVSQLTLLFYREKNIALYTEHQGGYVCQRSHARCEVGKMRGGIDWWRMGFGVRCFVLLLCARVNTALRGGRG